jgi:hypothetical protein
MPTAIVAATWRINTNSPVPTNNIVGAYDFDTKLQLMKSIIETFYANTQGAYRNILQGRPEIEPATSPLFIFAAPEYYFKKSNGERCLSRDERDRFVNEMSKLSATRPRLLIVPGTIIWKKPMNEKARSKAQMRILAREKQIRESSADAPEVMEKRLEKMNSKRTALTWPSGSQDAVQFLAYNTAYLFYEGTTFKYHKMTDYVELTEDDARTETLFIPGRVRGVFSIAGLKIGVEICGDHKTGMLDQLVDIHLMVSASTNKIDAHVWARDGGLFFNAADQYSEAFQVRRAGGSSSITAEQVRRGVPIPTPLGGDKEIREEVEKRLRQEKKDYEKDFKKEGAEQARRGALTTQVQKIYGGTLTVWIAILS